MEGVLFCSISQYNLVNFMLQGMAKLYDKGVEQEDLSAAITTYCKLVTFSEG